jgi:hypothetical protein
VSYLDEQAYRVCRLGDVLLPGLVEFGDIEMGARFDKQKRRGRDGIKLKDEGVEPAEFSIFLFGNNANWNDWVEVYPLIYTPKPGGERQPLAIDHPFVNDHKITTVYVKKIKVDYPTAKRGWKVEIKVEQWFPELKEKRTGNKARLNNAQSVQNAISRGTALSGLDAGEASEFGLQNLDPASPENIQSNLFD